MVENENVGKGGAGEVKYQAKEPIRKREEMVSDVIGPWI